MVRLKRARWDIMAIITASSGMALDMYETALASYLEPSVVAVNSNQVVLYYNNGFIDTLNGSELQVSDDGNLVSGTIEQVVESFNGIITFTADEILIAASDLMQWFVDNDHLKVFERALTGPTTIIGSDLSDRLISFSGNDIIKAGAGNDEIDPSTGTDIIDGGAGVDTLLLPGVLTEYAFLKSTTDDYLVSGSGRYKVRGMESIYFGEDDERSWTELPAILKEFDGLRYAAGYADLSVAFGTNAAAAAAHYVANGFAENRDPLRFDALAYTASYADLRQAFGSDAEAATRHYITTGVSENRQVTFDPLAYLASNVDLRLAFGTDATAGERHYIQWGAAEGRSTTFDAYGYLAANPSVLQSVGADTSAAAAHYITTGAAQGLSTSGFQAMRYVASNVDLIAIFGTDTLAATRHYVQWGAGEHRAINFDALAYAALNPDVWAASGNDLEALARHYVMWGYAEHRQTGSPQSMTMSASAEGQVPNEFFVHTVSTSDGLF